ncbi:alpha/beta hydrolase [Microbacterium sp.]|uniref:alpha/beta hydrolase n=1 Tax=Microbacterium sp. TaxID=51671 RepID=UPI003A938D22
MSARIDSELAALYADFPRLDLTDMPSVRAFEGKIAAGSRPSTEGGISEQAIDLEVAGRAVSAVLFRHDEGSAHALLVHVHGGGFVLGSATDPHTRAWCARTARETGAAVLAVDYRLAPEHPYPAGHDDCHAATIWSSAHREELGVMADAPIILHGQSAGGAIAAGVALRLRDDGHDVLAGLILDCPVVDDRLESASMQRSAGGPVWTIEEATVSWRHYLARNEGPVPSYAAPGRATAFAGLPPTLITINLVDALRDEALELARRMALDEVDVDLRMYAGSLHGSALVGMDVAAGAAINRDQYLAIAAAVKAHKQIREREEQR